MTTEQSPPSPSEVDHQPMLIALLSPSFVQGANGDHHQTGDYHHQRLVIIIIIIVNIIIILVLGIISKIRGSTKIIMITNIITIIILVPGSIPKIRGSITTSLFTSHQRKKAAPSSKPTFLDSNLTENQTSESFHRIITIFQIILLTILSKVYVLTQTNFPSKGGPRIGSRVLNDYHDHPDHNTHHLIQSI